jgi:hypothetical protein
MKLILNRLYNVFRQILLDSSRTSWSLFKIMVPIVVVVKILQELDLIKYLALPLSPIMELIGLPAQTGLIWATAIANNIYAAIMVYWTLIPDMPPLSVAQITTLSTMILIAHALPVECRVAQKCGVSFWGQFLLRMGGAFLCGAVMNVFFTLVPWLNDQAVLILAAPDQQVSPGQWLWDQLLNLGKIFLIITMLISLMRLLDFLGITRLFIRCLKPVLRLIGIGPDAATITIIGLTLGLGYGGGLIIRETGRGNLSRTDVFSALSLMGLSHALIEDTLLMVLLGASLYGVFWGRLIFSLIIVAILVRLVNQGLTRKNSIWEKVFF